VATKEPIFLYTSILNPNLIKAIIKNVCKFSDQNQAITRKDTSCSLALTQPINPARANTKNIQIKVLKPGKIASIHQSSCRLKHTGNMQTEAVEHHLSLVNQLLIVLILVLAQKCIMQHFCGQIQIHYRLQNGY